MADQDRPQNRSFITRARGRLKAAVYGLPGRDRWQQPDEVLDALEVRPGMRVLDVGAGGGYFTFRLADAVGSEGHVYALDPDEDMVPLLRDALRRRGIDNVTVILGEAREPQLGHTTIDLAVIVDALHHLPDPVTDLRALTGTLHQDGRLAVIEPWPAWWLFGHATDPAHVRSTLQAAGYEIVEEHEALQRQSFVVAQPLDGQPS